MQEGGLDNEQDSPRATQAPVHLLSGASVIIMGSPSPTAAMAVRVVQVLSDGVHTEL